MLLIVRGYKKLSFFFTEAKKYPVKSDVSTWN